MGLVKLYHIAGESNLSNHLTKGVEKGKFCKHTERYQKKGFPTRHTDTEVLVNKMENSDSFIKDTYYHGVITLQK